jgi:hypothetical protein
MSHSVTTYKEPPRCLMSERKSGALLTTPHGFGLGLSTVQLFFGLLYRKGMYTILLVGYQITQVEKDEYFLCVE